MSEFDAIREKVAVTNNVLLSKNDPALVSVTINDVILKHHVDILNTRIADYQRFTDEQNQKYLKEMLNALQKSHADAKVVASRIINDAAGFIGDQASNAISSAMSEGRDQFRKDLRIAVAKIEELRKATFVAAGVSFGCAILALGSLWLTVT